jgi:hypothetical protein
MEKCPIDMTNEELEQAIERAEMIMFIATDLLKPILHGPNRRWPSASIRPIRQEIEARRFVEGRTDTAELTDEEAALQ